MWLERLQLCEYTELFEQEGYSTFEDIENLKDLEESDLRAMGVSKRGMYAYFIRAIHNHNINCHRHWCVVTKLRS